ncbi:MAG: hypothetical protein KJ718_03980 [Nanoarchaeota archaeon]|nr:hypothetical protein [Nanoarchaeota archaeon]
MVKKVNRLGMTTKLLLGFFPIRCAGGLGISTEDDGSVMLVFPKYIEKAKRYAKLYEQMFGRGVTISLFEERRGPGPMQEFYFHSLRSREDCRGKVVRYVCNEKGFEVVE